MALGLLADSRRKLEGFALNGRAILKNLDSIVAYLSRLATENEQAKLTSPLEETNKEPSFGWPYRDDGTVVVEEKPDVSNVNCKKAVFTAQSDPNRDRTSIQDSTEHQISSHQEPTSNAAIRSEFCRTPSNRRQYPVPIGPTLRKATYRISWYSCGTYARYHGAFDRAAAHHFGSDENGRQVDRRRRAKQADCSIFAERKLKSLCLKDDANSKISWSWFSKCHYL